MRLKNCVRLCMLKIFWIDRRKNSSEDSFGFFFALFFGVVLLKVCTGKKIKTEEIKKKNTKNAKIFLLYG